MKKLVAHGFTSLEKVVATPEAWSPRYRVSATRLPRRSLPKRERISKGRVPLPAAPIRRPVQRGKAPPGVENDDEDKEVLAMSVADGAGGSGEVEHVEAGPGFERPRRGFGG